MLKLPQLIKIFQKEGQLSNAAALMLWYHSLRIATLYPELRVKGKCMWQEVARGFDSVEAAFDDIKELTGRDIPSEAYSAYRFIPYAFDPKNS